MFSSTTKPTATALDLTVLSQQVFMNSVEVISMFEP